MAAISFKAKVETIYNPDDSIAWRHIKVPALTRNHCDMAYFRQHPKFGSYANSDLFLGLLKRQTKHIGNYIRLDRELPEGVTVDTSGFLARVDIQI